MPKVFFTLAMLASIYTHISHAHNDGEYDMPHDVGTRVFDHIKQLIRDPLIVDAVRAQNEKNATWLPADIHKFDQMWIYEKKASSYDLIDKSMKTPLSKHLKDVQNQHADIYTEIIVMDNKGVNVGQSQITTDYWQGDEVKWQNTFLQGPGAVFIDKVGFDESTQKEQYQMSATIADPKHGGPIGTLTIGVAVHSAHKHNN